MIEKINTCICCKKEKTGKYIDDKWVCNSCNHLEDNNDNGNS